MDEIKRVTVLHGHVSPDTGYLVADYPYGRRLRCSIRYWIETSEGGAKRGQQRFVSQTTNPKAAGEPWNKPHPGSYDLIKWMYLDDNGHVQHTGVSELGPTPEHDTVLRLTGIYEQMTEAERDRYESLVAAVRPRSHAWDRWHETIALIHDHLTTNGEPPAVTNGIVDLAGGPRYVGADYFPVALALARQRLTH